MVTASTSNIQANVITKRPSWKDMKSHYPADGISKFDFYPKISKALGVDADKPAYSNTCALRMSFALNKSGVKLRKAPSKGGNIVGDDGRNYWLRVKDLQTELQTKLGKPDNEYEQPSFPYASWNMSQLARRAQQTNLEFISKIKGRNGVVVFEVSGWSDATGHFTLWDGEAENLMYVGENSLENNSTSPSYYFWMVPFDGTNGCTKRITFWELK